MMGESLVASIRRDQREENMRLRNAVLYGTSHPEIYKQEQDPMSITLRIEEIANGWLIHTDRNEGMLGCPSPIGPYFLPDADAVRRKLPQAFDDAVAEAKAREARYEHEAALKRRSYQDVAADMSRYTDDAGGGYAPDSPVYRDRGVSGFAIGDGFLRDGPTGAEFVTGEPTEEAGPEPHTSGRQLPEEAAANAVETNTANFED